MSFVYLDNNATTVPSPEVLASMTGHPYLLGNPASPHVAGRIAAEAVEVARAQVAEVVGCQPSAVTFCSGATEANNLAILGCWRAASSGDHRRRRIVVSATEHPSVLEAASQAGREGAEIVMLRVDREGLLRRDEVTAAIDDRTLLVSVMLGNNETGVVQDIAWLSELAHEAGAFLHTDVTQAVGRIPVHAQTWGVDLLSLSGHKFHGPRGVGVLVREREVPLQPLAFGGGQERGLRPGTLNTPGIAGLAQACSAVPELLERMGTVEQLRDRMLSGLLARIDGVSLNGSDRHRLPNTLNVRFAGADNEAVLAGLRTVMCSTGSACSSGSMEPSHVLTAMGLSVGEANESLRFSLSAQTTEHEVACAVDEVAHSVRFVREAMGAAS